MFKKQFRLTRDKEFDLVFKSGLSSYSKILVIKAITTALDNNRFGIMVGLKVSKKAVDRNRIKRKIREVLKQYNEKILNSYDIVVIALPAIKTADYKEIESSISFSLKRLRLLNKKE